MTAFLVKSSFTSRGSQPSVSSRLKGAVISNKYLLGTTILGGSALIYDYFNKVQGINMKINAFEPSLAREPTIVALSRDTKGEYYKDVKMKYSDFDYRPPGVNTDYEVKNPFEESTFWKQLGECVVKKDGIIKSKVSINNTDLPNINLFSCRNDTDEWSVRFKSIKYESK